MVKDSQLKVQGQSAAMVKDSPLKVEGQSHEASMVEGSCSEQGLFLCETSIGIYFSAVWNNSSVNIERIPVISLQTAMEALKEVILMKYLKNLGVSNQNDIIIPDMDDDFKEVSFIFPATISSLREMIDSKAILTTNHVKILFSQLILCLDVIHHGGIIHGDLKPGNLMVGKNCSLAIFDFGTSMVKGRNCKHLQARDDDDLQMVRYRAPELIMGSEEVCTASVDVWSAGCLLAELLNGGPLFLGRSLKDLIDRIPGTVRNLSQIVTSDLTQKSAVNLLSRMLQLEPSERITIQEILDDPFIRDTVSEFRERFVRGKRLFIEWEPEHCQDEAAVKLLLKKEVNEYQKYHQVAEEEQQLKGGHYFAYFAEQEPYHKSDISENEEKQHQTSCIQAEDDEGIIEEEDYCMDAAETLEQDYCDSCGQSYEDGVRLKGHLRRNPDHKMKLNKGRNRKLGWKKGAKKN